MTLVRGVTVLDLIAQIPPGAQGFLPDAVARFIDLLNVAEVRTRTSGSVFVHEGRVQSATEAGLELASSFPVEIPGLNVGVPFQLAFVRRAAGPDNDDLEGEPDGWFLDLFLDRVAVVIPIGRPAKLVPAAPVAPARLEPGTGTRVKLYARGVLRIEGGAAGTRVRVVADPDPIVPSTPIGTVIETGFSPPHLLLHDSGLGMTVDRVVLDLTDAFTPEDIVARGHGADFEGMTIREATVYLPRNIPFVGDVNFGVRDLLVGWAPTPALQGEARLELGVPLESATGVAFFQEIGGQVVTLGGPSGSGQELTVTVHADTGPTARLFAQVATPGVTVDWRLPDGSSRLAGDSGWFEVSMQPGARSLRGIEQRTATDGTVTQGQERTYAFVREAPSTEPEHAPPIRVLYSNTGFSHQWDDVVFLRGPGMAMDFVQFRAVDTGLTDEDREGLRWLWESDGSTRAGTGVNFDLDTGWAQDLHTVTLTDRRGRVRRCRIEVVAEGDLFVGHRGGGVRQVAGTADNPAPISAVETSWDLTAFHARDARNGAAEEAALESGTLTVPRGTLAEVTVAVGTPSNPTDPAPTTEPVSRHVRILMEFNEAGGLHAGEQSPTGWRQIRGTSADPYGPAEPYPGYTGTVASTSTPEEQLDASFTLEELAAWAGAFSADTRFVAIGQCCDLGTEARNRELANERARRGQQLLVDAGIAADRIRFIGEQGPTAAPLEPAYVAALQFTSPPLDPTADPNLGPRITEGWRFKDEYSASTRSGWGSAQNKPERKEARGVELYALVPAANPTPENPQPSDELTRNPALLRALVPGEDADVVQPQKAANVRLPYRVELQTKWDSPSIVEQIDWVPTLVQLTVEWASSQVPVPGLPGESVTPTRPTPSEGPDLWRVIGRFTTDQRSGQTSYFLSLDSMGDADGLFAIVDEGEGRADEAVAVALALAPALLGGITTDDPAGAAVRVGALIAASAAAAAVKIGDDFVINDGRVIVEKLEGEVRVRAIDAVEGMKVRIGVDYTASFGVTANLGGAVGASTLQPVKIKYKNVGLEYEHDETKTILERVRFVFEDAKFEVADPGQWQITGALGKLLGITAIRIGAGSVWVEVDLEFALDLGVVEISRTTIRVEIDTSVSPPGISVQLRGITAKIDVPSTIKGQGSLIVFPDGFGASLELDIIPAKLKAWGAFAIRNPNMVHIEGGVRFATGIPLGNTGLGLFGFAGRFVANGRRNIDQANTDIIGREVGWHALNVLQKYNPQPGQFAVGFGVYIGTMPDAGFTFNALGMLTIGFPDISVVFSIDAVLLSGEPKSATETKSEPPASSLVLLGIVAVDPTAVGIAIQGQYQIPQVLELQVPIGAYFPLQSSGVGGYVRVGSDGAGGRPDRPVTIRILPEVLDLRAFSFFMIEERHLHDLGGKDWLDFEGFSIGFGAGLTVKWGGGPIYLRASLTLLVGLGTRPLVIAGGIYVQGELRLVCISISVRGEIEAKITEAGSQLSGEFCGEVDFFFFSVSGCVSFNVGSEPAIPAPPPEPLISGLVLADKFSRVVGDGAATLSAITDDHKAWPDVSPVLRFAHRVKVNVSGTSFRPTPSQGWAGLDWSGTNRVRYLYQLEGVDLIEHPGSGAPVTIDTSTWPAAWWLPAFRNAVPDAGDTAASTHEGWELAVLHWDPAPWSRAHSDGGEGLDADPADSLGNVCEEPPRPTRYCVLGKNGLRINAGFVRMVGQPSGQSPYAPDFLVDVEEGVPPQLGVQQLAAVAAALGVGFSPGGAEALLASFSPPGETVALDGAWRAPRFMRSGFTAMSLGMAGTFVPEVSLPEVLLAVCLEVPDRGGRKETCVNFANLQPNQQLGGGVGLDGVKFSDRGGRLRSADRFPLGAPNGVSELAFTGQGLDAALPTAADSVSVDIGVIEDRAVVLLAFDATGREVARASATGTSLMVHTLEVRAAGIQQVVIWSSHGMGHLIRFCYTTASEMPEATVVRTIVEHFKESQQSSTSAVPLPRIRGTRQGIVEEWPGEIVGTHAEGRHGCIYVRYTPRVSGPWSRFAVLPYPWFSVSLIRVCGIRHGALVAADQDEQARDELQQGWNDAVTGTLLDRHQLLEADTRYEVRVRYKAATWIGAEATDNPPNANTFGFTSAGDVTVQDLTQSLFFRTASAGMLPDDQVPDYVHQHRFDPRALGRYLRGFDPVTEDPSHFRDDPLLAWFEIEWITELLDLYDQDLELIVQRTDPPPTPPSGDAPVIFPPITVLWSSLAYELRNLADRRMIDVAIEAPCLDDAPHEGATAQVTAPLEPRARYDLVVRAKPRSSGPAVEIGRSHFRASRYATATELIEATGFGITAPNPFYPLDLLVSAAPPTDVRLADDALLDAAISSMGLDPFAPAVGPRSVVLWQQVGSDWRLVAVMLDSDEALMRGPRLVDPVPNPSRLEVLRVTVAGVVAPAASELVPVRSNVSATRVLLAVAGGIVVPDDVMLELVVREPGGVRVGRRSILPMPLMIAQEQL
jgi:hypothetical protein